MLTYEILKENVRKFVSLTSLTPEEFEYLLPAFEQVYRQVFPDGKTKIGQKREQKSGGGRKGTLTSIEQKLLFALESVLKGSSKIGEWLNSPKLTRPI